MTPIPFDNSSGLVVLAGGLGCGKTELAVNLAGRISETEARPVLIVDLDNVKPYFKARNLEESRRPHGVRIVAPPQGFSNADLPVIPPEARAAITIRSSSVIVDVGGDESGARVLGGFRDEIEARGYSFFYVVNLSRPFLRDAGSVVAMLREIERQSGLRVTGLVNNTHMMELTDSALVEKGRAETRRISEMTGIPFAFTCMASGSGVELCDPSEGVFEMDLYFSGRV